ncbi:elongator complex protein 4 [Aplysia californica]|uniref:Elongator complex protein 4 n=1 Tax=Aplysia californica TaxID=6500 RepID=A0ABM0K0J4_APLCA|nr:elongator complex protein 4 [Aplysia californica]
MTSFQKKARIKVGQIAGTRPSLYSNQLLVSTGIPSLDNVIGGGLAVGTVMLVEEDIFGSYARLMLKYFTAEAIVSDQTVLLASRQESPEQLVQELPAPIEMGLRSGPAGASAISPSPKAIASGAKKKPDGPDEEKMKIAWRYQSQPKVQSTPTSGVQFGHYYDLTKVMDQNTVEAAQLFYASSQDIPLESSSGALRNKSYCRLLQDVHQRIQEGCFGTGQKTAKRSILRLGIHNLGSPLWGENGGLNPSGDGHDPSLTQFFLALRAMLRSALAVAMVTVPTHLFHDKGYKRRLERMADTVIRLESFAGSPKEKNPAFKEYHGLLHLVQLPRLNSLIPAQPETTDLAFKLRRKKFTIEKLHLPPELADTTGRSQDDDNPLTSKVMIGCSSSESSKLSF